MCKCAAPPTNKESKLLRHRSVRGVSTFTDNKVRTAYFFLNIFLLFCCSLLSTSRDSTYREDDSRNLIDEHNTNGSSIFFNLQQQLQKQLQKQTPIQPQPYNVVSTTTPNNNTNNKRCKTNSYTLCTTPPPPQYSIKKSSSCSSFLIDILFRGISHLSKIIKTFPLYRFIIFVNCSNLLNILCVLFDTFGTLVICFL